MKTILLISSLLTGCASVSEYNQGCRDGLEKVYPVNYQKESRNAFCSELDRMHKEQQKERK